MPSSQLFAAPEQSGEGLPYAPENWPEPGDVWGWKTGRRITTGGTFHDRYLYVPIRLSRADKGGSSRRCRLRFASKAAVERYIRDTFPNSNVGAFFASFTWKIPASSSAKGNMAPIAAVPIQQIAQAEESDSDLDTNVARCKARNKMCDSLKLEQVEKYSPVMPCDICCTESGFCRDCVCILCCKTIDSAYGGYSYIKCLVNEGEGICGHVAHMECALRSLLAGTVKASIGLDAEYHCRRCDGRTDLVYHVDKLLQTCKAIDLDEEIKKKILNLGACLLRGSKRPAAKELLGHIELTISKLKCVTHYDGDIWKMGGNHMDHSEGLYDNGNDPMEFTLDESPSGVRAGAKHPLKLEAFDEVLEALRKSQEYEFKLAQERLEERKACLRDLYQQLDSEKSELACENSSRSGALLHAIRETKEQIRWELTKFGFMKKVANGFGRTSKDILKEHFGLEMTD